MVIVKGKFYKNSVRKLLVLIILLSSMSIISKAEVTAEKNEDASDLPTTGFEDRDGNEWTTYDEELVFLEEVAKLSERMEYSQVGTSSEGRPLHLVKVGFPTPPSDEEIANGRNMLVLGSQHGNEPSGREMSLQLLRDLAFTDNPELQELLSKTTILFIPSANPDGREANTRKTPGGVNLNRDHLNHMTPEVQTITKVLNQFEPDITVDAHERSSRSPDYEMLWPRNLNMDEQLRALNIEMVEEYVRPDVEKAGYSTGLYNRGGGDERFLHNMAGLRHGIVFLSEPTWTKTPNERVNMQMEGIQSIIRFYDDQFDEIKKAIDDSKERKANVGANQSEPFYIDGADHLEPTNIIESLPCGYLLHPSQAETIKYC